MVVVPVVVVPVVVVPVSPEPSAGGGVDPSCSFRSAARLVSVLFVRDGLGVELAHALRAHQLVRHNGGDLRSRPVREVPGRPGSRSGGDGSDGAGGRKRGEALTHVPVIDRDPSGL